MTLSTLPASARFKLEMMFHGLRYSPALGQAAEHAFPNYYPYRFQPGEPDPTGTGKASIPYLLTLADETLIRIKGNGASPWAVSGDRETGYRLGNNDDPSVPVQFTPLPRWMQAQTRDGFPMARTGIELLGDMAVINLAPGCEYFLHKIDGVSLRCGFCAYGAPDERVAHLGQKIGQISLPQQTYTRMQETLRAVLAECDIRHLYLVGGSLPDWREEGRRYLEMAREVQAVNQGRIPLSCGSGALPDDILRELRAEQPTPPDPPAAESLHRPGAGGGRRPGLSQQSAGSGFPDARHGSLSGQRHSLQRQPVRDLGPTGAGAAGRPPPTGAGNLSGR
jgi:hypothetical protein